jgi:drug/metabolite transporter (DMT)-like permease
VDKIRKAYLHLHISVFLWGFTAVLGKLIKLGGLPLVWYRILITCLALAFLPGVLKASLHTPKKEKLKLAGIGILVSMHWVCFYSSIKYSNITISLSCLSTTSFITSLVEPLLTGRRLKLYELALGLLIVPGVCLLYFYSGDFPPQGIILGLLAAFFAAVFTSLNKTVVDIHEPRAMTFIELGSGFIFLSLLLPLFIYLFPELSFHPDRTDMLYLLLLAVGCTTLPFVLALRALKHLSAFASTLTVNLEPVYGIIMALLWFHESKELRPQFFIGTAVILSAVFIHPLLKKHFDKELPLH